MVFYRVAPGKAEDLISCLRQGLTGGMPALRTAATRTPPRRDTPASTFAVVRRV